VPLPLTRVDDIEYKTNVYYDLIKDEDYFHLGMCHWDLKYVGVILKSKGVAFYVAIDSDHIANQGSLTTYHPKVSYFDVSRDDYAGNKVLLNSEIEQYPSQVFSTTLTAKENFE
jgi:hypothetical protein